MFKLNAKLDADSLFCLLSHFECIGHTVHMLIQWLLPPPLTSTGKSSLFMHAHSSPLSLAARLHGCHTNHSCYIKTVAGFFQTSLIKCCKDSNVCYCSAFGVSPTNHGEFIKWDSIVIRKDQSSGVFEGNGPESKEVEEAPARFEVFETSNNVVHLGMERKGQISQICH